MPIPKTAHLKNDDFSIAKKRAALSLCVISVKHHIIPINDVRMVESSIKNVLRCFYREADTKIGK